MYSMGSSHLTTPLCVIKVLESKNIQPGGSAALMDLVTCLRLGGLLTKQLRTLIFIALSCVDFGPLT